MYVYFLRSQGNPKRLKIGKSKDPIGRMRTLQTGCPFRITLAGVIKCKDDLHALRVEKAMHGYFSDKRKQGEWFHCTTHVLVKMWDVLNQIDDVSGDIKTLSASELIALHDGKKP
jgi:hypothetical protein